MMQFRVRYGRGTTRSSRIEIRGHLTVTKSAMEMTTRTPLLPPISFLYLLLGGLWLLVALAFFFQFALTPGENASSFPPFMRAVGRNIRWVWLAYLALALLAVMLPIRRRRQTVQRQEITGVEVLAREVQIYTATEPILVTAQTTDNAQALATALREGTATPVTLPIRVGRELLFDHSGFVGLKPVNVSVADGVVTLEGNAAGAWRSILGVSVLMGSIFLQFPLHNHFLSRPFWDSWGLLIMLASIAAGFIGCFAIISCAKRATRSLPCHALRAVTALHCYVTFLAPDAKLGERRYTLKTPSPDDAATLARHLQGAKTEPFAGTYHPGIDISYNYEERLYLYRVTPERPMHAGEVLIDREQVTVLGRSGLAHPWAWRVAAVITLLSYPLLLSVVAGYIVIAPLPDADAHHRLVRVVAALLAVTLVYPPVSAILSRLWSGRMTVPWRRIARATRLGRQITLAINSLCRSRMQFLILTAETDRDADALAEALSARAE